MEICPTFVPGLYAFKFEGENYDELERLLEIWKDVEQLTEFFRFHEDDLTYFEISVEDAVMQTLDLRDALVDILLDEKISLDRIFSNLHNSKLAESFLSKKKAKKRWLRLYAIKIEENQYVITGGCIKLTLGMKERPHTTIELTKQEKCRAYLRENGVFDDDSFVEFIELGF